MVPVPTCFGSLGATKKSRMRALVVDDEPGVLELMAQILRRVCGFECLTAACPLEAYYTFSHLGESISLVLTDIVMPGTDGLDMVRMLAEAYPTFGLCVMSGYVGSYFDLTGANFFIGKPFTAAELHQKIRTILSDTQENISERDRVLGINSSFDVKSLQKFGFPIEEYRHLTALEAELCHLDGSRPKQRRVPLDSGIDRFVAGMPWLELLILRHRETAIIEKIKELRRKR